MADITLDPDDDSTAWVWGADTKDNGHDRAHDASAVFGNNNLKAVGASANVLQVCNPSTHPAHPLAQCDCFLYSFLFYFPLGFRSPRGIWC